MTKNFIEPLPFSDSPVSLRAWYPFCAVQVLDIYDYFMHFFFLRCDCYCTYAETLKNAKSETLKSVRSLLDAFGNGCANYQRTIATKPSLSDRVREIELRTEYVGIINNFLRILNEHAMQFFQSRFASVRASSSERLGRVRWN